MYARVFSYLVFTGLIQYVQGLHGHGLVVVVELCDQKLHPPAAEELHASTQQHTKVLCSIQPANLLSNTRSDDSSDDLEYLAEVC